MLLKHVIMSAVLAVTIGVATKATFLTGKSTYNEEHLYIKSSISHD
jgi:hypothetical protein